MSGALQTRGTCWFFSIINGFLLSDAGQKLLFASLEKFYKGLDMAEKAYFDDGIDAPCPLRADIIKTKRIYFYKFLDQYLCFRSGPRSVSAKMGRSGQILGGASLAGTVAKAHKGAEGALPGEELPKVLRHLGLTDYIVADEKARLPAEDSLKRPHFVVVLPSKKKRMIEVPKFRPKTYSLMSCSVTIGNTNAPNATKHSWHAVTGYVRNGKGYLFDSNQRKPFPCEWWKFNSLKKVLDDDVSRAYDFFAGGQINYIGYNFVIFSKNSYVDAINPVCRLKYKKTKTPLHLSAQYNRANFASAVRRGNFGKFNPAEIAALMKARARKTTAPVLGKEFFDSLPKNISNSALNQQMSNLRLAGYRFNKNSFAKFLKNKSPLPMPIPLNSPRTMRRKNIEKGFKNYWKELNANNRKTVRNLIPTLKSPSPKTTGVANAKKNINSLKTAKARAEWIKAKKFNFKPNELKNLKFYVKEKNQINKNRRALKKPKPK
jgi:hypothetical protein